MIRRNTIVENYVKENFNISDEEKSSSNSSDAERVPMEMDLTAEGPPDDIESLSKLDDDYATCKEKATRYAKLILPHIGLVALLALYTVFGAIVFHLLELPHEMQVRNDDLTRIYTLRQGLLDTLWDLTHSNSTSIDKDDFEMAADSYFDDLATAMYKAYSHQLITDKEIRNESHKQMWTFSNSIFFATTVITTIGYGNLAPITLYGRVFCILFGLFGIPLLLVTIADIGKFLSEFLSFLYRSYRTFKRKLRRQSRKLSFRYRSRSTSPDKMATLTADHLREDQSDISSEDELRIPVFMCMIVLIGYTALGGLLFRSWEGWEYFDAFYFCFITMATIGKLRLGFGDIVPTQQMYMFLTMAYIVFGLALATMCIDLAGTEYIRKIHYLGQKMETAKTVVGGALVSGVKAGEHLLSHRGYGFIRTAGGKLVHVGSTLTANQAREMGLPEYIFDEERNILYEPLSPAVQRQAVKAKIEVMPDQIAENDGYILSNRYDEPPKRPQFRSPNAISRRLIPKGSLRRPGDEPVVLVAPFIWKESKI